MKGGKNMKARCIKTYYDKQLHRTVGKGEKIEISDKRFQELSTEENQAKEALVEKMEDKKITKKER